LIQSWQITSHQMLLELGLELFFASGPIAPMSLSTR